MRLWGILAEIESAVELRSKQVSGEGNDYFVFSFILFSGIFVCCFKELVIASSFLESLNIL